MLSSTTFKLILGWNTCDDDLKAGARGRLKVVVVFQPSFVSPVAVKIVHGFIIVSKKEVEKMSFVKVNESNAESS